jgi:tubulin-folding cofactor B
MAMQTAADIPLNITSENSRGERRITPAWTIAQLKTRLEPITGIPASSQSLVLKLGGSQAAVAVGAADEEAMQLHNFPLQPYAELSVGLCLFLFPSASPSEDLDQI